MIHEKLWSKNYIFDITVNVLVYCVHFILMLWSTAYVITTWNASISMAGLASGIFIVGTLIARIPAGCYIDFVGRRKMLLIGALMFFLLMFGYETAPNIGVFMLIRLLHGISFGVTSTASSTIVASLIPLSRMGTGIGYFTLGVTIASAIGPFLAMTFISLSKFDTAILICIYTTLAIFLLAFAIHTPERKILSQERESLKTFSFNLFFEKKSIAISFISLMGGVCYSTVLSFLGAYTNAIGITGIGASCFFICFAATSLISRPLTGYLLDERGGNVVIYPALLCMAAAMLIIAFAHTDISLLFGALLLGFGYGTITASCHALAVHCAPLHRIGVATSTYFVFLDFGIGVGPYTLGSLVPNYGFSIVYIIAGIISLAGIFIYFFLLGRTSRFTRQQMDRDCKAKLLIKERREHYILEG